MFLLDSDIESRLSSPDNLRNRLIIHQVKEGRGKAPAIPMEVKKVLAIASHEGEEVKELAKTFEISNESVYDAKKGASSGGPLPELKETIRETQERIKGRKISAESIAIETMLKAVGLVSDKLDEVKQPKVLASIAKDMSAIAKDLTTKNEDERNNTVHLHLYAPHMSKVEDYEVIDV